MLGHLVGFMGLHGGFLMGKTNPNGKACPLGFHCGNFFGNIFLAFILGTPLFLTSFGASILGTTFFWKFLGFHFGNHFFWQVFGLPFWIFFWESLDEASILGTFLGQFLGFHFGNHFFFESFWASILGTTFFWKVFGLPFWELFLDSFWASILGTHRKKLHSTKDGSSGQVQCSDELQNIFHGIVIVSPSTCHVWYVWITKHSKPLPKIKSKVWGFGIPKVTKMKSQGLRLAILLTMQRMPKIKSQDLHSNHRFIMEIKSLGLEPNIFSWFETVVWIKSLDPTSNLPRLKSLERF